MFQTHIFGIGKTYRGRGFASQLCPCSYYVKLVNVAAKLEKEPGIGPGFPSILSFIDESGTEDRDGTSQQR